MKEFTIQLDEVICKWLELISDVTRKPIESIIVNGLYNQMEIVEDKVHELFMYTEDEKPKIR